MVLLAFWGHSDDRVMVDAVDADVPSLEFVADTSDVTNLTVTAPDGQPLRVIARYDNRAVWSFAVAQAEVGQPLPDWEISVIGPGKHQHNDYTTELRIICPRGTQVSLVAGS